MIIAISLLAIGFIAAAAVAQIDFRGDRNWNPADLEPRVARVPVYSNDAYRSRFRR